MAVGRSKEHTVGRDYKTECSVDGTQTDAINRDAFQSHFELVHYTIKSAVTVQASQLHVSSFNFLEMEPKSDLLPVIRLFTSISEPPMLCLSSTEEDYARPEHCVHI